MARRIVDDSTSYSYIVSLYNYISIYHIYHLSRMKILTHNITQYHMKYISVLESLTILVYIMYTHSQYIIFMQ